MKVKWLKSYSVVIFLFFLGSFFLIGENALYCDAEKNIEEEIYESEEYESGRSSKSANKVFKIGGGGDDLIANSVASNSIPDANFCFLEKKPLQYLFVKKGISPPLFLLYCSLKIPSN